MWRAFLIYLTVLIALSSGGANAAQRRVAVVVGVGAYQTVPQLANPPRDARAIAASLTRLGFDTTLVIDPDRAALERAVRTLGEKARNADAAVFFYAGHALEAGGRNYIVPVGARIASTRDLAFETVDLDLVGQQVDGQARTVLVFLDACRNNPFTMSLSGADRGIRPGGGLAAPSADASGTLIAFATAPGRTADDGAGEDSPFTTALLHHIDTPGLEVRQMLGLVRHDVREATDGKQVPWESSALEGAFFFNPGPNAGKAVSPSTSVPVSASAPTPPATPTVSAAPPPRVPPAAAPPVPPLLSRSPGSPVVAVRPDALVQPLSGARSTSPGFAPAPLPTPPARQFADTRPIEEPIREARCHVLPVTGLRRPGGTSTVMEVASDGRGCGFRIFVRIAERVPFESLVASELPLNGQVSVGNNSRVIYTPKPGFVGEDRFTVTSVPRGLLRVRVIVKPAVAEPTG